MAVEVREAVAKGRLGLVLPGQGWTCLPVSASTFPNERLRDPPRLASYLVGHVCDVWGAAGIEKAP